MKVFTFSQTDGTAQLRASERATPAPKRGEVLIQVRAAGVTPTELLWYPTTHSQDGRRRVNAVPGHEFSGVVAELGEDVPRFAVGDEIFGMNDWFAEGATAEYCVAPASSITLKPPSLSHVSAAAVPISALTAWQALVKRADSRPGERLLILGAAGAVGLMAVQIATILGCHVVASASQEHFGLLRRLGVQELIDYRTSGFENLTKSIDIVFDTVGSDSLQRAEPLLNPGGRMVTIAADAEGKADPLIANSFFIVEPSEEQLRQISDFIVKGQIESFVKAAVPFGSSPQAYLDKNLGAGKVGKLVILMDL